MIGAGDSRDWLNTLREHGAAGYEALLVAHDGSISLAAYELVCHQLRVSGVSLPPRGHEILLAAREIADHTGWDGVLPIERDIVSECVNANLPVMET